MTAQWDGKRVMPYALLLLLVALGVLYYFIDPMLQYFPLQCPWRTLTGTLCPACGLQRAFHALMHGRWLEALGYNYFFILSVPFVLMAVAAEWYNWHHKLDGLRAFLYNGRTLYAYVGLYFGWWILRNLLHI